MEPLQDALRAEHLDWAMETSIRTLDEAPETLHHFTPAGSSILRDRTFWLTAVRGMNDHHELDYAYTVLPTALEPLLESSGPRGEALLREGLRLMERWDDPLRVFAMCFSGEKELSHQWKGYANEGRGLCINIDSNVARDIAFDEGQALPGGILLTKVRYQRREQAELIRRSLRGFSEIADEHRLEPGTSRFDATVDHMRARMATIAAMLKDAVPWEREKEWRFLTVLIPRDHGRIVEGMKSHIPLQVSRYMRAMSVTTGPCSAGKIECSPARVWLDQVGLQGVDCNPSRLTCAQVSGP